MLGELQESWLKIHGYCLETFQQGFLEQDQQIVDFMKNLTDSVEALEASCIVAGIGFSQELANVSLDIPPQPP